MTSDIKSHQWRTLLNLPVPILLGTLEIMADHTEICEQAGGPRPQLDYCIGLAMDRMKEAKIPIEPTVKPIEPPTVPEEEKWHNESPNSRRRRIREARLKHLDTPIKKPVRRGRLATRRAKIKDREP